MMERNQEWRREGRNGGAPREERGERRYGRGEIGEGHAGWTERRDYSGWEDRGRSEDRERDRDFPRDYGRDYDERRWRGSETPSSGTYGRGEWGSSYHPERSSQYGPQSGYGYGSHEDWYRGRPPSGAQYGYRIGRPGEDRDYPPQSEWGRREEPSWGGWRRQSVDWDERERAEQRARGFWGTERVERRGRPPRNYRRSDERIRDEVCELIARQTDVDASEVEIQVASGVVTLVGEVEDRAAKRELEDVAERVFGVADVNNNLRVRKSFLNQLGERLFGPNEGERKPSSTPGSSSTTTTKS
jgi:hypothetical protein